MHIAIISEEYERGIPDGGLRNARDGLRELLPEARFFVLGGRRYPRGLWGSWRAALKAENFDARGFDLVITLGAGFASGVITQPFARHAAFFFARPPLGRAPGLAGHWYRLWRPQMSERVDRWVANSRFVAEALEKDFRVDASVVYPCSSSFGSRAGIPSAERNQGEPGVVLIAEASDANVRRVCRAACERLRVTPIFAGEASAHEPADRRALLRRALFTLVPEAVSFSPWIPEAFAAGRPVLCYRSAGLPELVEEGATGLFFDDLHPGVMADGMRRMRGRLDMFNQGALRARAEKFSGERFKAEFLKIIENVVQ